MIEFTDWAIEVLRRAHEAATRLNPDARIRLTRTPQGLSSQLASEAEPGDSEVQFGDATILVAAGVSGMIDVEEPHDRIVLRSSGTAPNPRPVV